MKDKALIYISLLISIAALCYAAWLHCHAEDMATKALRQREQEIVRHIAPKLKDVVDGVTGRTNSWTTEPTSFEDLLKLSAPVFKLSDPTK